MNASQIQRSNQNPAQNPNKKKYKNSVNSPIID